MTILYGLLIFGTALETGLAWYWLSNRRLKVKNEAIDSEYRIRDIVRTSAEIARLDAETKRIREAPRRRFLDMVDEAHYLGKKTYDLTPQSAREFARIFGYPEPGTRFYGLQIRIIPDPSESDNDA